MQPTLSVEEFQRFQSQLLDLRESQIQATDARLRAEARAKQLEAQVAELRTALSAAQPPAARLDQLTRDNEQLRVKLLSTESAFQLQSSTLRAECLHLSSELDRLTGLLNRQKQDQITQTDEPVVVEALIQTDFINPPPDAPPPSQFELDQIRALEARVTSLTATVHTQLEVKVTELEHRFQTEVDGFVAKIARYQEKETSLEKELNEVRQAAKQARESEHEARNQLASVKSRCEKLNRELRRQLSRLLRPDVERASLRKLSIYSSSSSLSSATTNVQAGISADGDTGSVTVQQQNQEMLDSSSSTGQTDVPAGFFPMSDVKTLVDRLSEVQEENCSLRRQVKRLDAELVAKTRALQVEMSNRLTCGDCTLSPSPTSSNAPVPAIHTVSQSNGDSEMTLSRASNGIFSPLSSMFSNVLKSSHTDPTTLSSANLETVNRLKRMCENLLTENMRLSAQLESVTRASCS